jgi:hypothetical protein
MDAKVRPMPDDKIQREIEDILSRLDDLPAERKPTPMRRRSRQAHSFVDGLFAPLASISIRHVMLAALALIVVGFFTRNAYPAFGHWTLIGGVLLFFTAIVLSMFNRGGSAPAIDKRWRGQPMDLSGPTIGERLRAWYQAKRRQRY